jgi:mono/diheme cytochrome c family protein
MNVHAVLNAGYAEIRRAKSNHDQNLNITLISSTFMLLNMLLFLFVLCVICASTAVSGMQRISRIAIVAVAPLLMAAMWMDKQPSPKPYQAPVLVSPAGSVPVTGTEIVSQDTEVKNPLSGTAAELSRGKTLFATNCAMCHGASSAERGPVGKKLNPPPPGLGPDLVRDRTDAHIFKAVTLGFGRMPPFKDKLTRQERWELVNYLRTGR